MDWDLRPLYWMAGIVVVGSLVVGVAIGKWLL